MEILLLALSGIAFPLLKLPVVIYILARHPFPTTSFHYPTLKNFQENYFWWHFGTLFGLAFFTNQRLDLNWFTWPSIIYNLVVYQAFLLSQWPSKPITSLVITTVLQFLDGSPFLFALIDNMACLAYSDPPHLFLPEKTILYMFCSLYDIFRLK